VGLFYAFVPALVFRKLIEADLSLHSMGAIGGCCLVHLLLDMCGRPLRLRPASGMSPAGGGVVARDAFDNAGYYGIPLILQGFGGPVDSTVS